MLSLAKEKKTVTAVKCSVLCPLYIEVHFITLIPFAIIKVTQKKS